MRRLRDGGGESCESQYKSREMHDGTGEVETCARTGPDLLLT